MQTSLDEFKSWVILGFKSRDSLIGESPRTNERFSVQTPALSVSYKAAILVEWVAQGSTQHDAWRPVRPAWYWDCKQTRPERRKTIIFSW